MKVQVEEVSPIEKKLSIEVEQARVSQELDRAYTALSRQVKIAGFRPGKVPRRILEQRFREQVEDDVVRRVVELAYFDAIREHDVAAVSQPRVTPEKLTQNAPFKFEARVEVKPKLQPKDYAGLELKKAEEKVDDAKVQEQLERIQKSMGRLEPVEGRDTAQKGDYATIDYKGLVDGKPFPGNEAENITVQVEAGELVEGKIPAVEGMKVGETKEIDYAFPADYGKNPRTGEDDAYLTPLQGKVGKFQVSLKGLKHEVTPAIDDELAKEVQGGNTLEELKAKIRADLEKAAKNQAITAEREELITKLVEKNPFEVPQAMVERAIDMMLDGALRQLARSGFDPRSLNMDFTALREEMRPRAVTEVKGTLLLEAIAEKEKIEATEADADKKIEELAADAKQAVSAVKKMFKDGDSKQGLMLRLREEKTIEFLKGQAKYS